MRTKKKTRNTLYTQAFFGQSPACTYPHSHGSSQVPCSLVSAAGMTYAEINREISVGSKALLAATHYLDGACTFNERGEPELKVPPEGIDTFELKELDQCMTQYDAVCDEFAIVEDDITSSIGGTDDASGDDGKDPTKVIVAKVQKVHLKPRYTNAVIDACICAVQFFLVEKKFNFMMENFDDIARQNEARHGVESPPRPPPTLTRMFNDPKRLVQDEAKEGKKPRPPRRPDMKAAMLLTKRLCMLATKDIQAVNRSIKNEDYSSAIINNAIFKHNRAPANIPDDIVQALYDFDYVYNEIVDLREQTTRLRDRIRCTMVIWVSTSKEAWEYGRTHIHDFPDMRYYEYLRVSLVALYTVWLRVEAKIFRYCEGQGGLQSLGLTPRIEEALQIRQQGSEGVERDFEASSQNLKVFVRSVDDMVKQLEGVNKDPGLETHELEDDWWKVFMPGPRQVIGVQR